MFKLRVETLKTLARESIERARYVADTDSAILIGAFIKAGCVLHCIREYVGDVSMLIGPSMLPTINSEGDVVLLNRFAKWAGTIQKGDVIIADSPRESNRSICKRVRGLGGDIVTLPAQRWFEKEQKIVVPEGHMWLEGDNSANSMDSRTYGPIPQALLRGRVWLKIWPISEFGVVDRKVPPIEKDENSVVTIDSVNI